MFEDGHEFNTVRNPMLIHEGRPEVAVAGVYLLRYVVLCYDELRTLVLRTLTVISIENNVY